MDKRTILFVFSLSLTLFCVNLFFQNYNSKEKQVKTQQLIAKKEESIKKLEADITKRTAPASAMPLVALYSDAEAKEKLAVAVESKQAVLAISWDKNLPQKVYKKALNNGDKIVELTLATLHPEQGEPVVYRESEESVLPVGDLPELGKYEVQLVVPYTDSEGPAYTIYLGDYVDGNLSIPAIKVDTLKRQIKGDDKDALPVIGEGFVLAKTGSKYIPVAIYNSAQKLLEPLDALSSVSSVISKPKERERVDSGKRPPEKFYVLETPYQQLVFSSYGGALAEINLPFKDQGDEESVVKEIQFDRDMVGKHSYNAHFPAHAYYTSGEGNKGAFEEHTEGALGGYYPLIRRDLIRHDKRKSVRVQPRYYALNIISEYPETAELVYDVKSFTEDTIVLETTQGHRRITKTFSVASDEQAPYTIDLTIDVEGDARGLWLTSGIPEVEWISGAPAPALKFRITRNQKSEVENVDLPKDAVTVTSTNLDWITNSNGFLGMIMDPISENDPGYRAQVVSGTVVPSRLVEIDSQYDRFVADNLPGYIVNLPLRTGGGSMHYRIFAGPFATKILKKVDTTYSNLETGYNPDYIASQSFHGWFAFISEPFAKFLFILMNFFHTWTGSWALSIVLLTVALRIMLYPLNAWSTKSMVRMQQLAPDIAALDEKYKKDPKKAQMEKMNLFRERGVNPVSGCFPLLIQMPFLIGMFDLLKSTFELRGASFIPGWIDDLTAPDVLFSWTTPLPLIGNQFHLLPILLGLVMFVQQRLMSTMPKDPALLTDQQRQQKFMGNIMSIVFMVMFYNFPSGLNLYWLSSMLLGIVQQYFTTKQMNKKIAVTPVEIVVPVKGNKK
ncbi:MAG TPA: membrane protein insertase YidC [Parachlamydiaceae bacterium]|nr:membrane protein insertase YidC [Parachlamydiaceae bacterium]